MTRTGKIARLPLAIRDELNRRLADSEPGGSLLPWLNSLPAARTVLECQFGGAAITKQNLSEWRKGGFLEWRARQELLTDAHQFSAGTRELREASEGCLTDDLSTVLAAEYAMVLSDWNGKGDETLEARLRVLHGLSQAIGTLRHGEHRVAQLKFEREKLAFAREKAGTRHPLQELACDPTLRDLVGEDLAGDGKGELTMDELLNLVGGAAEAPRPNAVAAIAAEADGEAETGGVQPSPTWSNEKFFRRCSQPWGGIELQEGLPRLPGKRGTGLSGRLRYGGVGFVPGCSGRARTEPGSCRDGGLSLATARQVGQNLA